MKFSHRWDSPGALQATGPHELHKIRRVALNPFFSKRQVLLLWPYIIEKCATLHQKIEEWDTEKPLNLSKALGCFSIDVVTEYAFGQSFNDFENEDFFSSLTATMDELLYRVHVITHLPWILNMMASMPKWVQRMLNPGMLVIHQYHTVSCRKTARLG